MKAYRITVKDEDGWQTYFTATLAEFNKKIREFKAIEGVAVYADGIVNLPTDKSGLLALLNHYSFYHLGE